MTVLDRQNVQTYSHTSTAEYSCVKEAEIILRQREAAKEQLDKYLRPIAKHFYQIQKLISIKEERSESDWDGHNARPVSLFSLRSALIFLISVPERFVEPVPGVCSNGQITLEWRRDDGRLLSLAFDEKGQVNYIAFLPDGDVLGGIRSASLGYDEIFIKFLEKVSQ